MAQIAENDETIKQRMSVWQASSELFFTPCIESDTRVKHIVNTCLNSGYSLKQLDAIYKYELIPTLFKNVSFWSNSWPGFEDSWLREKVVNYLHGQLADEHYKPSLIKKLRSAFALYFTKKDWKYIKQKLQAAGVK